MKRTIRALLFPVVVSLLAVGPPALGQADEEAYGDDYRAGNYARVRYHDGGVTVLRAAPGSGAEAEDTGQLNSPVFPGDTLITDFGQRAEVQLAAGTIVRVDRDTELTFLALPDPYATIADNTILQLSEGSVRIDALLSEDEEFRIDTPASSVYLLGDGDFRIEVDEDGFTQVFSRRGVAELVGQGGSVLVRGGTRAQVYPGSLPREAGAFNTFASDSFDRWVEDREAAYRGEDRYADNGRAYEELPREVRPYYRELSSHGGWVYTSDYGYVWYPERVAVGWRPYTDGYWSYGPNGYFWVSYEPWGWAPYHYGRWAWVGGRGWCWIPGRVFAGAWVAWSWGSLYVGWSPLDYWNEPCFVRSTYYGYYDPYAWTFVHYRHFGHRRYHRYAVGVNDVGDRLRTHAVVTRPPRVAPRDLATSDGSRDRAGRLAREDRVAALRPVAGETRRRRPNMRELERDMVTERQRERRSTGLVPPRWDSSARRSGAARGPSRGDQLRDDERPGRQARPDAPYERRLTHSDSDSGRRTVDRTDRPGGTRADPRRGAGSRTSPPPRRVDSDDTDRRVRDLYQRMSRPRTTREPSRTPPRDSGARPSSEGSRSQPGARPTPPPRPQPKARPTAPSSRSQPRARPTTPPRPQPKARPGGSSPRPQPKARPGGSSSSRARPKASPSRGGSKSGGSNKGGSRSRGKKD